MAISRTPAQKKAISVCMKKYWAMRRLDQKVEQMAVTSPFVTQGSVVQLTELMGLYQSRVDTLREALKLVMGHETITTGPVT